MHLTLRRFVAATTLAAASLPLQAQVVFQALGTAVPNLTVTDMSPDGSALVGTDGNAIYVWTTTNPTWSAIPASAGWGEPDVSNGGTYVSMTLPDPSNGNMDTAARWSASTGQWTFLGGLGGQSGTSLSSASGISGDGSIVVGLGWVNASRAFAYRWDAVNGMQSLGVIQGSPSSSRADGVSADGSTIIGWDSDPISGVWRAAQWVNQVESLLGCLNPAYPIDGPSHAYAASSNGTYVVGESNTGIYTPSNWDELHTFRWDATNGLVDRGTCNVDPFGWGSHHTIPSGVSDDGRTIVGLAGTQGFFGGGMQPFISREGSPMRLLSAELAAFGVPEAATWIFADVSGISGDGRVIAGYAYDAQFNVQAYRVTFPALSETYCVAKVNSQGCTPAIAASGIASPTSALSFDVSASNVLNNKSGLCYYGFAAMNAPFQGGTKCVASPVARTAIQNSGGSPSGNDCTGAYSLDFNDVIQSGGNPLLVVGASVFAQYWSRDPASASTTGLTNAVSFTIFP